MPENSKKINSDEPFITSPDGVRIQITAGRKLQQIRTFMRDPKITDAQFRVLACLVDRLNDGTKDQESRWGSAYPQYETLANDVAKDIRSTKRIIKELETGQRETRTRGVTKLVPCREVLSVERSEAKPGRGDVNQYRLKEWGAFVENKGDVTSQEGCGHLSTKGAVTGKEGCGDLSGRVRSPVKKGAVTSPDSTHPLPSASNSSNTNSSNSKNASGGGPANSQVQRKGDNDNESRNDDRSTSPWPDDYRKKFWDLYPRKPGDSRSKALAKLERIERSDSVEFSDLMKGLGYYAARMNERVQKNPDDRKFIAAAQNWLDQARWETEEPVSLKDKHAAIKARVKVAI
ncbi:helix-turn-helix domain-containing protein [Nitrobacter sp. TKz-YC02]|uniref:helix-turn-helix domain-containing protein n=1 Tax=Nitrobacter sp. TKz-YC02 TaxID=3398704 RepID=UPI003CEE98A1